VEDEQSKPSLIDDALAEIGRIAFNEPAICTGWVLVSEWFNGSKDYWTLTLVDDEQPEWRHMGLLNYSLVQFKEGEQDGNKG